MALAFLAFPQAFRSRHRADALDYFEDRARERLRFRGVVGLAGLLVRNVSDTLVAGIAERRVLARTRTRQRRPGAGLLSDARAGLRSLRRQPGFLVAAGVPLALGIAGVTAVFAVVDGVVLKPLPYPDADAVVEVGRPLSNGHLSGISAANLRDIENGIPGLEALAYVQGGSLILKGMDPEVVQIARPSRGFMDVFRLVPAFGRSFEPDDFEDPDVAVITWSFWQRHWGGDPSALGGTVETDMGEYRVVGILPRSWQPSEALMGTDGDLWVPLDYADPTVEVTRAFGFGSGVGRVAAGSSLAAVNEQLAIAAETLWKRHPDANSERDGSPKLLEARSLHAQVTADIRPRLVLLLGAVVVLLAIACANVANLFLARGAERQRELAVRNVLGASRPRLIGQLLFESVVVALAAGMVGLVLAYLSLDTLVALTPELPRADSVGVDPRVASAALLVSLLSGAAFGVVPAFVSSQRDPGGALRGGHQPRRGAERMRATLVIGQTALALMLVVGGGLLVNSAVRLAQVDSGFRDDSVLVLRPRLHPRVFGGSEAPATPFFQEFTRRLAAIPGVHAVSGTLFLPGRGMPVISTLEDPSTGEPLSRWNHTVLPGFFELLDIPIVEGRSLLDTDTEGAARVAVVSRTLANELWPGESPIGRRMRANDGRTERLYSVVGVAGDIRNRGPHSPPEAVFYESFLQNPWLPSLDILVRHDGDAAVLLPAVRDALRDTDPNVPLAQATPLPAILASNTVEERHYALLLTVFSLIALAIASMGVYATVSYTVARRMREMGIRRAVGARGTDVATLVFRRGMLQAGVGSLIGLALAFGATRTLRNLLFGITSSDPVTYAVVGAVLLTSAFLACALPAIRATRVDPLAILRSD